MRWTYTATGLGLVPVVEGAVVGLAPIFRPADAWAILAPPNEKTKKTTELKWAQDSGYIWDFKRWEEAYDWFVLYSLD